MSLATDRSVLAMPLSDPEELVRTLAGESRIAFDLDGTLYDTRDFERPALAAVVEWLAKRVGRPLPGMVQALWSRREQDRHRPGLFDDLLREQGLPASWGDECVQRFHSYPGSELETAASLRWPLTTLRTGDRRFALVSNGNPELQKRKLDRIGMTDVFEVSVYCDPRLPDRLKPSAWAWAQLVEWRDARPAVFVGDDPVDAAFAAAGGARFIAFRFRSPSYGD